MAVRAGFVMENNKIITKFPYRCKILSPNLLAIFLKYKGRNDFIMELLADIKDKFGHITEEDVICISEYLDVTEEKIRETVKLHDELEIVPIKQHVIKVCRGLACHVCGSDKLLEKASEELKISAGNATEDGKFKLEEVECVGLCTIAPVMAIDNVFYGKINTYDVESLIAHEKQKNSTD